MSRLAISEAFVRAHAAFFFVLEIFNTAVVSFGIERSHLL